MVDVVCFACGWLFSLVLIIVLLSYCGLYFMLFILVLRYCVSVYGLIISCLRSGLLVVIVVVLLCLVKLMI